MGRGRRHRHASAGQHVPQGPHPRAGRPLSNLAAAGTYEGFALEQARIDSSNLCGTPLEQMVERRKELHLAMMANLHEELSLETDAKHREVRGNMSSKSTNEGLQLGVQKKCSHRFMGFICVTSNVPFL